MVLLLNVVSSYVGKWIHNQLPKARNSTVANDDSIALLYILQ